MEIRRLEKKDRDVIKNFLERTGVFKKTEVTCAMELIDMELFDPGQEDYLFKVVVDNNDQAIGYVCYGFVPLTDGVYDMYWIATDPVWQGKGVGKYLQKEMEAELKQKGVRMVLAETSSQDSYAKTRLFYKKRGYELVSTIKDFYSIGDDKLTYRKDIF